MEHGSSGGRDALGSLKPPARRAAARVLAALLVLLVAVGVLAALWLARGGPIVDATPDPGTWLRRVPPSVVSTSVSAVSWIPAAMALVVSVLVLAVVRRRQQEQLDAPVGVAEPSTASDTFLAVESVGEAMLDAGYPVVSVHAALEDIARVNGHPATEVVVFPTALIISTGTGERLRTRAVSTGSARLLLHQVDALDRLVDRARVGAVTPGEASLGVSELRAAPPPYSRPLQIVAYTVLCAALAVFLGGSWTGLLFASAVGTVVGLVLAFTENAPRAHEPLVIVALAFGVSAAAFLVSRAGWDPGVLPALVAPLVILLPGGLLTTGVIELASGQMMSGAGRLAGGFMRLILLAAGFVAGALLVGVPRIDLREAYAPLGPVAPWIAVAVFGIAIMVNQGGRPRSIPWVVLVLYVAYGAQVLGSVFFGGVLSALVGALVMTPVAIIVSSHPSGPAAMVSFLPAFWLLVPGALGLVGITNILAGDSAGATTLVTTVATMVAIALGILTGSALLDERGPAHDH